jgi:predicted small secreted protein
MINSTARIAAACLLVFALASCGNTIRGFGKDASNTVDATEDAARDVQN